MEGALIDMKKKLVFILIAAVIYSVLALVMFPLSYAGFYLLFWMDKLIGGPLFQSFAFGPPSIMIVIMIVTGNFVIGCLIGWAIYALESRGKINLKSKIIKRIIWSSVLLLAVWGGIKVYNYFVGLNTLTKLTNSTAGDIVPVKIVLRDLSCEVVITSRDACRFFAKFMSRQEPKYSGQSDLYTRTLSDVKIVWPNFSSWTVGTWQVTPDSIGVVPTTYDDEMPERFNALPIDAIDPVYDAVIWFLANHRERGELCLEISDQNYPQGAALLQAVLANDQAYILKTPLKTQMIWSETLVLQIALVRKNWEMAKLLLDQGCSVDGGIPLAFTTKDTPEEITSMILGRSNDLSYLKYVGVSKSFLSWRDFFVRRWQEPEFLPGGVPAGTQKVLGK